MIAELNIETALRAGSTYLKNAYFSPPFKLANITEDKRGASLRLMLMSSSPGIMDGDEYHVKIDVASGCSLELQTQSYQRLFTMKKGAIQHMEINVAGSSSFCYLPHPCVPHTGAVFTAKNKIFLGSTSNLQWGEVLTCGRKLNGEEFLFSKYHNLTEIFLGDKLIVKENLLIIPQSINVHAMGQLEGYSHQASFICIGDGAKESTEAVSRHMESIQGIEWGVSGLQQNGFVLRILGYKAEQLHSILKNISALLPGKAKIEHAHAS